MVYKTLFQLGKRIPEGIAAREAMGDVQRAAVQRWAAL